MVHVVSIGCIQVEVVVDERTWRCVKGNSVMDFRTPFTLDILLGNSLTNTIPPSLIYRVTNTSLPGCRLSLFIRNGLHYTILMKVFSYKNILKHSVYELQHILSTY